MTVPKFRKSLLPTLLITVASLDTVNAAHARGAHPMHARQLALAGPAGAITLPPGSIGAPTYTRTQGLGLARSASGNDLRSIDHAGVGGAPTLVGHAMQVLSAARDGDVSTAPMPPSTPPAAPPDASDDLPPLLAPAPPPATPPAPLDASPPPILGTPMYIAPPSPAPSALATMGEYEAMIDSPTACTAAVNQSAATDLPLAGKRLLHMCSGKKKLAYGVYAQGQL